MKVGTRAKKGMTGEGERKEGNFSPPPSPLLPLPLFHCSRSNLRAITRLETLTTRAIIAQATDLYFCPPLNAFLNKVIYTRQAISSPSPNSRNCYCEACSFPGSSVAELFRALFPVLPHEHTNITDSPMTEQCYQHLFCFGDNLSFVDVNVERGLVHGC